MDDHDVRECSACGGDALPLGKLGRTVYYRCRQCGWQLSERIQREEAGDAVKAQ